MLSFLGCSCFVFKTPAVGRCCTGRPVQRSCRCAPRLPGSTSSRRASGELAAPRKPREATLKHARRKPPPSLRQHPAQDERPDWTRPSARRLRWVNTSRFLLTGWCLLSQDLLSQDYLLRQHLLSQCLIHHQYLLSRCSLSRCSLSQYLSSRPFSRSASIDSALTESTL